MDNSTKMKDTDESSVVDPDPKLFAGSGLGSRKKSFRIGMNLGKNYFINFTISQQNAQ